MQKLTVFILSLSMLMACQESIHLEKNLEPTISETDTRSSNNSSERVVVANRASKDISVIDAATNTLIGTYLMPDNGEPMYVVHIPQAKSVFVGDRANNRVVAFDEDDFSVKGTVPCGAGVFHMWASPNGSRLWVNNDIDNTTSVISPTSMKVKGTAETPADLVALGGKPHDVFVGPDNQFAYVSVLGVAGDDDFVIKYSGASFAEVGRAAVGQDPHLSATDENGLLYVPCQNSNAVYVVDRSSMTVMSTIPFIGAHGAAMSNSGDYFYSAGISNSTMGTINTSTNSLDGPIVNTPYPTAHNLAINASDTKLFVTHSGGTSDKLTIYDLDPNPVFSSEITVGTNPFGLAYYQY